MTGEPDDRDDRDLTGAWALHALTPEERADFDDHLRAHDEVRAEATELADTAVMLGLTAPLVDPPRALRDRLLAAIEDVPQATPDEPAGMVVPEPATHERMPEGRHAVARGSAPLDARRRRRMSSTARTLRFTRRSVAVLGSSLAVLVALVIGSVALPAILAPGDTQAVSQLRQAPDARTAKADIAGGGTATLVWSDSRERSAMTVADLAAAPSDRTYQLWYIRDGAARSAGLFSVDSSGNAAVALQGRLRAGDTVGVTVEPKGGSESPTTKPIVAVETA